MAPTLTGTPVCVSVVTKIDDLLQAKNKRKHKKIAKAISAFCKEEGGKYDKGLDAKEKKMVRDASVRWLPST